MMCNIVVLIQNGWCVIWKGTFNNLFYLTTSLKLLQLCKCHYEK